MLEGSTEEYVAGEKNGDLAENSRKDNGSQLEWNMGLRGKAFEKKKKSEV